MFRKIYNQALITGYLVPDGPVSIVEGGAPADPVSPSLAFVRTRRAGELVPYLPGSSLKGVLRAQGERLLTTLLGASAAEDPFEFKAPRRKSASEARSAKDVPNSEAFRLSCEADRLYGSTEVAGRFQINDALPEGPVHLETHFNVAIDRTKQSVRHGPFEVEVATEGRFRFQATLENYELWMLCLVLQTLRDLDLGLVRVGHAKSRGLGVMKLEDPQLTLTWSGRRPGALLGAGACEPDPEIRTAFGLVEDDRAPLPEGAEKAGLGLLPGWRFTGFDATLEAVSGSPWQAFVERAG